MEFDGKMGGLTVTVSLRFDENKKIHDLMDRYHMKRHEVIKLAIRRFLFPDEANVPLNGRVATMPVEITLPKCAGKSAGEKISHGFTITDLPEGEDVEITDTEEGEEK